MLSFISRVIRTEAGAACLIDEKERKPANELEENVYRIQQIIPKK